ncbi:MAG: aminoacyl-tRNA hydrolase [Porticoccaceae bacterium]|nr:aminoacyl-tRNA hydrolase [Porticoccaceae bacterium]
MLIITQHIAIPDHEIDISAIRAQGAGGQNVNKVSSAIHLRFDIKASSLLEADKESLLNYRDRRITSDGVIVIKAQKFRTQEKNRLDARERLRDLVLAATHKYKSRKATKPTFSSRKKRVDNKTRHGKTKALRGRVDVD